MFSDSYVPKAWHHWVWFFLLFGAFLILHNYGDVEMRVLLDWSGFDFRLTGVDVAFVVGALCMISVILAWGIERGRYIYRQYLFNVDTRSKPPANDSQKPQERPTYPDLNHTPEFHNNAFLVDAVKISAERYFAFTLCRQHDSGFKPDLRESYWIAPVNRYHESPAMFRLMKANWRAYGLIEKVARRRNATDDVTDWAGVKRVANGNPLPIHASLLPHLRGNKNKSE